MDAKDRGILTCVDKLDSSTTVKYTYGLRQLLAPLGNDKHPRGGDVRSIRTMTPVRIPVPDVEIRRNAVPEPYKPHSVVPETDLPPVGIHGGHEGE